MHHFTTSTVAAMLITGKAVGSFCTIVEVSDHFDYMPINYFMKVRFESTFRGVSLNMMGVGPRRTGEYMTFQRLSKANNSNMISNYVRAY